MCMTTGSSRRVRVIATFGVVCMTTGTSRRVRVIATFGVTPSGARPSPPLTEGSCHCDVLGYVSDVLPAHRRLRRRAATMMPPHLLDRRSFSNRAQTMKVRTPCCEQRVAEDSLPLRACLVARSATRCCSLWSRSGRFVASRSSSLRSGRWLSSVRSRASSFRISCASSSCGVGSPDRAGVGTSCSRFPAPHAGAP